MLKWPLGSLGTGASMPRRAAALPEKCDGGIFMAIRNVVMDRRDSADYRNHLKRGGFLSASYLSISGFDAVRLKKLALQGKLDAIRCAIGKSIRWYYSEKQAELAHLRGEA
jgi:hypothetical protein